MEQQQLFIAMALNAWNLQISRIEKFFFDQPDEILLKPIAPGKNRPVYLLGHLVAVHDMMAEIMGIGERKYQHLDNDFIKNPDGSAVDQYSLDVLKQNWKEVHQKLADLFNTLQPADWFKRHNSVSEEDFAQDPTRNRLNLVMNRTGHVAYHHGQLKLVG